MVTVRLSKVMVKLVIVTVCGILVTIWVVRETERVLEVMALSLRAMASVATLDTPLTGSSSELSEKIDCIQSGLFF